MCVGFPVDVLREKIPHNPNEVLWTAETGPRRLRGIQVEDLIPIIWDLGYYCMPFFRKIMCNGIEIIVECKPPMDYKKGLLMYADSHHVVAWDAATQKIYDPIGVTYDLREGWVEFWVIERRVI